jgi:hypothetical protein
MARSSTVRRCAIALSAAIGLGCGEFPHTNPFDPSYPMLVSLRGPDSTHSIGDTVTFTVATTPVWSGPPPVWAEVAVPGDIRPPGNLVPLGDGRFRVTWASQPALRDIVGVTVGGREIQRSIWLLQTIVGVSFLGHTTGDTLHSSGNGALVPLTVHALDLRGNVVVGAATLVSRAPSVVKITSDEAFAMQPGLAWLVASAGVYRDSVLVKVE